MKPRLISSKTRLMVATLLLLAASFVPARARVSAFPSNLVTTLVQPTSDSIKRMADALGRPRVDVPRANIEKDPKEYDRLLSYSNSLEQQLERANQTIQAYTRVGAQNQLHGDQYCLADVTAVEPGGNPTLTLNRGYVAGVKDGDIVISSSGPDLVGWVGAPPGAVTSVVRLITAPRTLLTVRILPPVAGPAPQRELVALEADARGQVFVSVNINHPEQFSVGDIAYLNDDRPEAAGRVVGRVVAIEPDPRDPLLRRQLVVRPEQSLNHLSQVIVVIPPAAQNASANQ